MSSPSPVSAALPLLAALLLASCADLSSFDTAVGEAYCGQITLGSGYRAGFSPRVQMRLVLDTGQIEKGLSPGRVSTYDGGSADAPRLLDETPLRPIPALAHDPLSELEFGDGRERNLIYAVSPRDLAAESLLAVVSLRSDDAVEVRLVRPGIEPDAETVASPQRRPLYGLFLLQRRPDKCGF
ncbi:MAG: hypothetical protein HY744_02740 [Deltaproteobacteria bacterium]|nr:hypothetical protein [Deltaproteobacteria bacterium]